MTRTAALIGTGMVARTHLLALRDAPGVRLGWVMARSRDSAEAFARMAEAETGHRPEIATEIETIAGDPGIDLVIIATPPDARMALIGPLAAAGKPILLEKPVARTGAEAAEVVAVCEAAGVALGVVFQHRVREASRRAAEIIAAGDIGAPGLVEIAVPWWREQAYYDAPGRGTLARDGGGVLISQAIHTLDLALALAGPVTEVTAMTATTRLHRMETEDMAAAGLHFASGAVGWLTASTASFPGAAETITLHHEHASLRLGEGVLQVAWRDGRRDHHGETATTGGGADPMAFTHGWHQAVLEDFLTSLDHKVPPMVTGREALRVHALIDAITASAARGHSLPVEDP